jgi:hypothetical protein
MSASLPPLDQPPLGLWVACVIGLATMWIVLLLLDYHHRSRSRNPMPRGRIIAAMTAIHPQSDERLPHVQCPAPPPSPRLKRIYESQEADEEFSKELHALLKIEVNTLLPSRVPNGSLYTFPSYLFSPEGMVGWESASRATQVQKRMLSDPRFIGVPEEDWEKPQAWDPRDRHPIGGYEIDKDEYYEGTGGYFETWETWQNVKRGYWMEKLLGPTKKDEGNQPRGEDHSLIINIEGGPQSAAEEEGGHQPVIEGGGHPSVGRRDGSGSSSIHLVTAPNCPAHSVRQRGGRDTS